MITGSARKNLQNAKSYFRKHLVQGEYYTEGEQAEGHWFGKGVVRLGLDPTDPVTETAFARLCDNLHPLTGEQLTVRRRLKNRRVFYDFVASAMKSASAMALTGGDERILPAHEGAARAAFEQMERRAQTRVREGGKREERITGEIVAAMFTHDCSRSLDPQLHTHLVIFNATWDAVEGRWKALEAGLIYELCTFFTEVYRSELAVRLQALGYRLRPSANGFEIEGVSPSIIKKFSKRSLAIAEAELQAVQTINRLNEQKAAEKSGEGIQAGEPRRIERLTNNGRAAITHSCREGKIHNISGADKLARQRAQLTEEEWATLIQVKEQALRGPVVASGVSPQAALQYAISHLFERQSVVAESEVVREALAHGRGGTTLAQLESLIEQSPELIRANGSITTREMLRLEQRMISLVNASVGRCRALNRDYASSASLSEEQLQALTTILGSSDKIVGIRGGAGTGKSTLLKELVRAIEGRHSVFLMAPTATAVEILRKEGFRDVRTLQRFLIDETLQTSAQGQVVMVDEAGLLSTKDMVSLLEVAQARNFRLILCGDTRQHGSVLAGDALRILETQSALRTVELKNIRRQVAQEYRQAIADIAEGKGVRGLLRLQQLGAVQAVPNHERYRHLAADYLNSVKAGKSALIVCPTWREIEKATLEVRECLKADGLLGKEDSVLTVHRSAKWTSAQKRNFSAYHPGHILTFHKETKHFRRGEWAQVITVEPERILVRQGNRGKVWLTGKQAACFDVGEQCRLPVSAGDRLLLQGNRKEAGLLNGQVVTVKAVAPNGRIRLADERIIEPDFKAFTHGYCLTSPASQGRTVDHVFVAVDSQSFPASNLKQLYVSVSRGREQVKIYTDDAAFLEELVTQSGARLSAVELTQMNRHRARVDESVQAKQHPGSHVKI